MGSASKVRTLESHRWTVDAQALTAGDAANQGLGAIHFFELHSHRVRVAHVAMFPGMIADLMTFARGARSDVGCVFEIAPDDKEGSAGPVLFQPVEHLGRDDRVRSVIERERHAIRVSRPVGYGWVERTGARPEDAVGNQRGE